MKILPSWLRRRTPTKFSELDETVWARVWEWIQALDSAPLELRGKAASRREGRGEPILFDNRGEAEAWLRDEVSALVAFGKERVESNRRGTGDEETVDYELGCYEDRATGVRQIVLFLKPRNPRIGRILLMCEVAKSPEGRFLAWGSGLEHQSRA